MTPGSLLGLAPILLGFVAVQPGTLQQSVSRLVVQDEIVLRIPMMPRPMGPRVQWIERKGPKCIPVDAIRRALMLGPEQVDFMLSNHERVRAEFDEDCPALDFYGSFYLRPEDHRLCARRDAVYPRMGGSCTIARFKQLVPHFERP